MTGGRGVVPADGGVGGARARPRYRADARGVRTWPAADAVEGIPEGQVAQSGVGVAGVEGMPVTKVMLGIPQENFQ